MRRCVKKSSARWGSGPSPDCTRAEGCPWEVKGWLGKVVTGPSGREQALARTTLLKLGDESQRTEVLGVLRSGMGMRDARSSNRWTRMRRRFRQRWKTRRIRTDFGGAAAGRAKRQAAIPVLRQTLADNPRLSRGDLGVCAFATAQCPGRSAQKAKALDSSEPAVRAAAVQAAVEQDSATAALLLERAARDPDKQVRLAAVAEVARLTEGESRPLLRTLMRDRDPEVRAKATAVYQQQKAAAENRLNRPTRQPDPMRALPSRTQPPRRLCKTRCGRRQTSAARAIEKAGACQGEARSKMAATTKRARLQQANALCGREAQKACAKFRGSWVLPRAQLRRGRALRAGDERIPEAQVTAQAQQVTAQKSCPRRRAGCKTSSRFDDYSQQEGPLRS